VAESSRRSDAPPTPALERAWSLARHALAVTPAGLLTDYDGTLSPIVGDPTAARLVAGADGTLAHLADRLAVVAIVTGRAPLDARRMTGVPGLLIAGNHGLEWFEPGAEAPTPAPETERVRRLLVDLLARVPPLDGVFVEEKGLSAAVHYRNAAEPETARQQILDALGPMPDGLERRHGRMSIELRPTGLGDKGAATRQIIDRFGLRGVVVMGDDMTDLDMFSAVAAARERGVRGAIIGVGGAHETPPQVTAAADVVLADPREAAELLALLTSG
jgi:trehalose 6-phosphate phosphatase